MAEGTLECARLGHGFSVETCRWVTATLRDIYHITKEAWLMPNPLPKSKCMIKKNTQLPNLFHLQSHPRTHLRVETPKRCLFTSPPFSPLWMCACALQSHRCLWSCTLTSTSDTHLRHQSVWIYYHSWSTLERITASQSLEDRRGWRHLSEM